MLLHRERTARVCFGPKADIGLTSDEYSDARQDNPDFGELAWLRINLDRAAMLLDDNVVTDGEAEAGPFSCGFRGEERVEHFFFHARRNAGAVVANCYLDTITQIPSCGSQSWLVIAAIAFGSAFGRCVKAIGDQIKQSPRNVLWEDVGLACAGIQ